jgi:pimeloyl-ACP methyl ester carboxylesterase
MNEHALRFGRHGSLIGILTEGQGAPGAADPFQGTAAVLFNAGLVHHIGSNRIYVTLARNLAAMGLSVLRFDFSGIGDSGPRLDKLPAEESKLDDARQAMDMLQQRWGIGSFICIGLCAGGAAAAQVGMADRRVKAMVLINSLLPNTPQTALMRDSQYYTQAMFNPRSWLKFLFLRSNYRGVWKAVSAKLRRAFGASSPYEAEMPDIINQLKCFFNYIKTDGIRLLILFSESDIGDRYLQEVVGPDYELLKQSGLMHIETLSGADHQVTPRACQRDLLASVTSWLRDAA